VKQRKRGEEEEEPLELVQDSGRNLLDFCDEVLIEIFQYLDTFSIMAMMQ